MGRPKGKGPAVSSYFREAIWQYLRKHKRFPRHKEELFKVFFDYCTSEKILRDRSEDSARRMFGNLDKTLPAIVSWIRKKKGVKLWPVYHNYMLWCDGDYEYMHESEIIAIGQHAGECDWYVTKFYRGIIKTRFITSKMKSYYITKNRITTRGKLDAEQEAIDELAAEGFIYEEPNDELEDISFLDTEMEEKKDPTDPTKPTKH
jgi:hypothetical protein